jgi:hypothetical protein
MASPKQHFFRKSFGFFDDFFLFIERICMKVNRRPATGPRDQFFRLLGIYFINMELI